MLLSGVILNSGLCIPVYAKASNNPSEPGWDTGLGSKIED